ncbi:MAG: class I tRNA ligase family protein, partial [Candidatus Marinimicrobia bacterium]|nr:class I tRNA ligase family protein [Candidatus Neomarinimicrobiota bacterium]
VVNKTDLTQLDSWILAKVNIFVKDADEYYKNFQVFKFMKEATRLLDDISNWYVRRNRRRFWKSESDSDKTAAYYTLYTVLVKYIKVMSPIIPFLSEKMYQNLVVNSDKSAPSSIHLTDFPEFDEALADDKLIHEVDTVINIVSLGRSARNKANIKIRQPLSEIVIYCDDKTKTAVNRNKVQVLEELNLKNLRFVDVDADLITYSVKPNFAVLGQKLGKEMKNAISQIEQMDNLEIIKKLKHKSIIQITILNETIELTVDDLAIVETPKEGFSLSSALSTIVGINTHISAELENEGIVRDLIRQVQNLRKDSGLKVEDRIDVELKCDENIENALSENKTYFMTEVLALDLKYSSHDLQHKTSFNINGNPIELSIAVKA